jgi:hypothetical protein
MGSLDGLEAILKVRAAFHCEATYNLFENSSANSKAKDNELFATDVQKMTKYHLNYTMVMMCRETARAATFKDARIKPVLEILIRCHALSQIMEDTHSLYECGLFGKGSGKLLD